MCWGKVAHTTALTSNLSLICFSGKFISISAAGKRSPRYFQRMGIFSWADRNLVILISWYAAGYPYLLICSWLSLFADKQPAWCSTTDNLLISQPYLRVRNLLFCFSALSLKIALFKERPWAILLLFKKETPWANRSHYSLHKSNREQIE